MGLLLFSALAGGLCLWLRSDDQVLDRDGVKVVGTVIEINRFQRLPNVRVRFVTQTGRSVITNVDGDGDNLRPGDHVAIEYAEKDPSYYVRFAQKHPSNMSWKFWGATAIITLVTGAGCLLTGERRPKPLPRSE